jgi:hypothetical protein
VLGYGLFLLVIGALLVRPGDLHPSLYVVPLYEMLIVPCILASLGALLDELSWRRIVSTPTTVCVLGLWATLVVSGVVNGKWEAAFNFGLIEYGKIVLTYLLMLAVVTTPRRLRGLMATIVIYNVIATGIAVLHYHGLINIQAIELLELREGEPRINPTTGTFMTVRRMAGTGVFGDPNDMCEYVAVALTLSLAFLLDRGGGPWRCFWLAPMAFLAYAMTLTRSRGGLLAAAVGMVALGVARTRSRRAIIAVGLLAVLAVGVVGGRQGSIEFSSGTGKSRLELWTMSLPLLRGSPIFGVGPNQFVTYAGHVAHNSFVEAYADLGVVGGTLHFGAYFYAILMLWRLGSPQLRPVDPYLGRLLPFMFAAQTAYAAGEMSLTHPFAFVTASLLGMSAATIRMAQPDPPPAGSQFSVKLLARMAAVGLSLYIALIFFAKLKTHWG